LPFDQLKKDNTMYQNPLPVATMPTLPPEVAAFCGNIIKPHEKPPLVYVPIQKKDANGLLREIIIEQKLGKWLKASFPQMEQNRITYLVESYVKSNADLSSYHVELSTDYAGIYQTPMYYLETEGKSCMIGKDCVQVYEYDDRLRLLCVYNSQNELCARTLVRLDKMQYIRLFIDKNKINPVNLLALVESTYTKGNLEGIMLAKLEHSHGFVCPYLDGDVQKVAIKEDYLLITSDGDYEATNTAGYIEAGLRCCCCDSVINEDDSRMNGEGETYCYECYNDNHCYCEHERIEVHPDEATYISSDNLPRLADHRHGHGEGYYSNEWLRDNIMDWL
jgi:hypothetical protein